MSELTKALLPMIEKKLPDKLRKKGLSDSDIKKAMKAYREAAEKILKEEG